MPENDPNSGRKPRVNDDDFLDVFRETVDPVLSTAEVAEAVPIKRRGTLNRLKKLEERGDLDSKRIGGRNTVWWLAKDDIAVSGSSDTPETRREEPVEPAKPQGSNRQEQPSTTAIFADVDFPSGRDRGECIAAINAAREYLSTDGPASMREIVASVHPDHPLGYDVDAALAKVEAGERYRGAWWRRIVKPGLEAVGDVQPPSTGQSDWRYTGADQ